MYKKGDLVQITSCLLVDSCYGVKVGMKARVICMLGSRDVLLEFVDTSIQSLNRFPMYTHQVSLVN